MPIAEADSSISILVLGYEFRELVLSFGLGFAS